MKLQLSVALLGLLLWSVVFQPFIVDDAYISARYAANLCDGHGLIFNPGATPVEGFSNLLWTLLAAPFACAGRDPIPALKWIGWLLLVGTAPLAAFVARRANASRPASAATAALVFAAPASVAWAFGGLEAPLLAFLLVAAVAVHESASKFAPLASALWIAACLTRVDAAGIVVVYLLVRTIAGRADRPTFRRGIAALVAVAVALGAVTLWRLQTYGAPLPNTAYAKVDFDFAIVRSGFAYLCSAGWAWWLLPLPATPFLVQAKQRPLAFALVAAVFAQLGYVAIVGGDWMPMHRFIVPIVPLAAIAAGLLLSAPVVAERAKALTVLVPCAALVVGLVGFSGSRQATEVATNAWHVHRYTTLGQTLAQRTPPNASLAISPAGAVPFFSQRAAIDMLGLNDLHIARAPLPHGPVPVSTGHARGDAQYVLANQPTIVIFSGGNRATPSLYTSEAGIVFEPQFPANYSPQTFPPPATAPQFTFPAMGRAIGEQASHYTCERTGLTETCQADPGPPFSGWVRNPRAAESPAGVIASEIAQLESEGRLQDALQRTLEQQPELDRAGIGMLADGWIARFAHQTGQTDLRDRAIAHAQSRGELEWKLFEYWLWTDPRFEGLFPPQ